MNIFIDCGTNDCGGFGHFINHLKVDETWQTYSFEANPKMPCDCLPHGQYNLQFHHKAVWIHDGFVTFKQFGDHGKSAGSLIAETGGGGHYHDFHADVVVESIDFHKFISQFSKDDNIYIKMDIEHAEYDVIEDMIKKGWPENIKEMWIEWHALDDRNFYQSFSERKKGIIESLVNSKTVFRDWH